jgi:post-segregation antitoxin (ccd killing protein)
MTSARRAPPKSATNVRIRRDLRGLPAPRRSIDLSATLKQALIEKLPEAQGRQWREENRESTAAYNQHVEKCRVFR